MRKHISRVVQGLVFLLVGLVTVTAAAAAAVPDRGNVVVEELPYPPPRPTHPPTNPKIDPALLEMSSGAVDGLAETGALGKTIDVAVLARDVPAAIATLHALGAQVVVTYGDAIQARVPANLLTTLAESPDVLKLDQTSVPDPMAVSSEGIATTNASAWFAAGIKGTGVKIAVIDVGFAGYQTSQQLGDLPADLTTVDYCGGTLVSGGLRHGTAVAEIVYDMAPGASLYLICANTTIALGAAKDYAKAQGIKIINMSAGYYNQSRGDGTGGPTTADGIAADARANGILWVNSAGNSARSHWSGTFSSPYGTGWHVFSGTDQVNRVTVPTGARLCAYLRWDQWPTATTDYDLFLYRVSDQIEVARSNRDSTTTLAPPTEGLCYTNSGATEPYGLAIRLFSGTATPRLDLFVAAGATLQYQTPAGSIVDPAASASVLSVGAVCWQGSLQALYGSQGPTIDGRIKPDISGPTQVTTAAYGAASGCDTAFGFGGTSGSSPHVAGAAALVLQANPTFTPSQIQSFLEQRSTDYGVPGKDNIFGSGVLSLGAPPPPVASVSACTTAGTPASTTYLPNITRRLGGPNGWNTPFYVQNAGSAAATIEASFYLFDTGGFATCHKYSNVAAGASIVDDPNSASDLLDGKQYSVVVKSFGSPSVAAVNQAQTTASGALQALSYSGFNGGNTTVYVPNVTRRFYGYDVPLIVQNLGTSSASITATFTSFSGTQIVNVPLTVGAGLSGVIDPDFTAGLTDQTQYAVKLVSSQPIGVVANAHNEAIGPVAFSHNGLATGASTIYAPYATKSASSFSPVVVQNVGPASTAATLTFTPLGGGTAQVFSIANIAAGGAQAFDVRFASGIALPNVAACTVASATCLGNGDYSLAITTPGSVAAVVLPNSNTTAAAYLAVTAPTSKVVLPVVQRNASGWNGHIYLQSISAASATLSYYQIGTGALATTQTVALVPGTAMKIAPASVSGLSDFQQYSVVISGTGTLTAIVNEVNLAPGDGTMIYEGFAQ